MYLRSSRRGTFQQERAGQDRSNRFIGWVLTISFCIALVTWYVFISGHWTVQHIETNDLQFIERGDVASSTYDALDRSAWKPWNKRNIFLIDTTELAEALTERLFAETVTVEKSYPNILRLKIQERQRSVILAAGTQLLHVDTNGLVTGDAEGADAEFSRLILQKKTYADFQHKPLIETTLTEPAASGYQVAASGAVKGWIETYKEILDAGMKFRYIKLTSPTSTAASLVSDKGFLVIIDLLSATQPQIETYLKFMGSAPKDVEIHEYIDVRIPGKIYVK